MKVSKNSYGKFAFLLVNIDLSNSVCQIRCEQFEFASLAHIVDPACMHVADACMLQIRLKPLVLCCFAIYDMFAIFLGHVFNDASL